MEELKKILFIDDSPEILSLLSLFMDSAFQNPQLKAKFGNEGIEILKDHANEIGMVICDFNMSDGMNIF